MTKPAESPVATPRAASSSNNTDGRPAGAAHTSSDAGYGSKLSFLFFIFRHC